MSLRVEPVTKNSQDIKRIKELFYSSFPKNEQIPIGLLLWKSKMDFVDFYAFILIGKILSFTPKTDRLSGITLK